MNTIKFVSPLFSGSQQWHFVCKAMTLWPDFKDILTDGDTFVVNRVNDPLNPHILIMSHKSHKFNEERELFAFVDGEFIDARKMFHVLSSTLKNTWVEHLV